MRFRCVAFCFILLLSISLGYAQPSGANQVRTNGDSRRSDPNRQDRATQNYYEELARRENMPTGIVPNPISKPITLFDKLREDAIKTLEPNIEEKAEFESFLKQPHTGLIRIAAENDCSKMVDVSKPDNQCLNYYLPGKARAFSFRKNNYTHQAYADFERMNGKFVTPGTYVLGLMANLGNTQIESISAQDENVLKLLQFVPADKIDEIIAQNKKVSEGLNLGNLTFRKILPIEENTTYLLRSVAYNAKFKNLPKSDNRKGSLDEDERSDVIVVFRVVRKDFNDRLLIVWKEIYRKKAPKIEVDMAAS